MPVKGGDNLTIEFHFKFKYIKRYDIIMLAETAKFLIVHQEVHSAFNSKHSVKGYTMGKTDITKHPANCKIFVSEVT